VAERDRAVGRSAAPGTFEAEASEDRGQSTTNPAVIAASIDSYVSVGVEAGSFIPQMHPK